jgi:putative ABC transport system permease protein
VSRPRGDRLYALLLLAFPSTFRRRFGAELHSAFTARLEEARATGGRPAVLALWLRTVPTVLLNGVGERWSQARERPPSPAATASGRARARTEAGTVVREIVRAARGLVRAPRYTLATVATFALVIGAATLFFAVVEGVILRPLPYPHPDRLVFVGQREDDGKAGVTSSYALLQLGERSASVQGVAAFSTYVITLTGAGDPVRLTLAYTSSDYFDVVGVQPTLGRGFLPAEAGPGAPSVVVVSDRLWRTRFQADPGLVGRSIVLDAWPYQVVGVMPRGFEGPEEFFQGPTASATDIWMPSPRDPIEDGVGYRTVRGVARLVAGVGVARFRQVGDALAADLHKEHPDNFSDRGFAILPLRDAVLARGDRRVLFLLSLAIGLVLLVGCANVAGLAVARGLVREEARAVRVALGAGRGHLVWEVCAEVLLLGLLGGAAGVAIAAAGLPVFLKQAPPLPRLDRVGIDGAVAAAACGITLFATLLGALLPSLDVMARSPARVLGRARGASPRRWARAQQLFAAFQVAVAVALLGGALLADGSLRSLLSVDRGFEDEGVRVAQIDLPQQRYEEPASRMRFAREASRALDGRSGIERVAFVTSAPQVGINNFGTRVGVEGFGAADPAATPWARFRAITPGYLEVMGIRLVGGRDLDERDIVDGAPVSALVNEEFARRYLAGGDPIGRSVSVFGQSGIIVVGVVGDVRYGSFAEDPEPELYLPWAGRFNTIFMVARARGGAPAEVSAALRSGIHALDPSIPMDDVAALSSLVAHTVGKENFLRFLVGSLALLVLALSAVGTYAVLAEAVARRARELGIRVALGARRETLLRSVLGRGASIVGGGTAVGLLGAYLTGRGAEGVLFGVSAADPRILLSSAALVSVVGLAASWLPARRATRADPLLVLRGE